MAVAYDPMVVQSFAEKLYKQARMATLSMMLTGSMPGLVCIGAIAFLNAGGNTNALYVGAIFVAVIGALIGFSIGRQRSFSMRLKAQTALCQVAIAENTKRPQRRPQADKKSGAQAGEQLT